MDLEEQDYLQKGLASVQNGLDILRNVNSAFKSTEIKYLLLSDIQMCFMQRCYNVVCEMFRIWKPIRQKFYCQQLKR